MTGGAAEEVSFMDSLTGSPSSQRSYGKRTRHVQRLAGAIVAALALLACCGAAPSAERTIRIVAFGDSLTAGLGLPASEAFPAQLERALKAKGAAVEVTNAGVSGDTTTGGLARLDWSVPDGTDAVILELGANDMLRGIDPKIPRQALTEMVQRLKARGIEVLLCGMRAAPNLGPDYVRTFDSIYPQLAAADGVLLYPFFLDGIAADPKLNQPDGLHPTGAGVAVIVQRIMPTVEDMLGKVRAKQKS